jgi:hypothetical protein
MKVSKPDIPLSAGVGTSGIAWVHVALVVANTFKRPALMCEQPAAPV